MAGAPVRAFVSSRTGCKVSCHPSGAASYVAVAFRCATTPAPLVPAFRTTRSDTASKGVTVVFGFSRLVASRTPLSTCTTVDGHALHPVVSICVRTGFTYRTATRRPSAPAPPTLKGDPVVSAASSTSISTTATSCVRSRQGLAYRRASRPSRTSAGETTHSAFCPGSGAASRDPSTHRRC